MKIAIRMDDITPNMDLKKFEEFKALLDEYGIKPLIGVVPDNQDDNLDFKEENRRFRSEKGKVPTQTFPERLSFWEYIKELQEKGWIVAQHGYRHVYSEEKGGMFPLNRFSEFAGVPLEKQREMINSGKQILRSHGIETEIFMAPAHSYDKNTLTALKQAGFHKMTDGFGSRPYGWQGITFYPISFRLSGSLRKKKGYTTMVVHTNTMTAADLKRYRNILEEKEVISYGDYLMQPAAARGILGRGWEYILANGKRMLVRFL